MNRDTRILDWCGRVGLHRHLATPNSRTLWRGNYLVDVCNAIIPTHRCFQSDDNGALTAAHAVPPDTTGLSTACVRNGGPLLDHCAGPGFNERARFPSVPIIVFLGAYQRGWKRLQPVDNRRCIEETSALRNVRGWSNVACVTETTRRSLLERLVGRPLPWLVWAWVVLAAVWIVLAFADPSALHTALAIVWTLLAAVQFGAAHYRHREHRRRDKRPSR